jgi:molybdopterin converting factor small subunit
VQAATVREALRALESAQPELRGWILDERGLVRRHINVFVDGEMGREETALDADARVDVLPAISGGAV